jgi:hypothetical protein
MQTESKSKQGAGLPEIAISLDVSDVIETSILCVVSLMSFPHGGWIRIP